MILYDTQAIASAILDYPYHIYLGLVNENKRIESILADKPTAHIDFEKTATMITGIKVGDKVYRDPGTGLLSFVATSVGHPSHTQLCRHSIHASRQQAHDSHCGIRYGP